MKRKTVVVLESGRLPELNMLGPITKPTRIALASIAKMVQNGKNVQECDPSNPMDTSRRIKLTVENVTKDNFSGATTSTPVQQPKKEEVKTPVQEPKKEEPKVEPQKVETPEPKKEAEKPEQREDEKSPVQQNQQNNNKNNGKKNK